ncbi:hypothetical protein HDU91_003658 [Kappamyces sp. JEL0680]|nr:hypothetical protein HDU91_003658 [Kappamyces sp. JEL0680]
MTNKFQLFLNRFTKASEKRALKKAASEATLDAQRKDPETAPVPAEAKPVATPVSPVDEVVTFSAKAVLYSRGPCPFTEIVRLAFAFKRMSYHFIKFAPGTVPFEEFDAVSKGTVPLLKLEDGSYINSSAEMLAWLESAAGPSLFPKDCDKQQLDDWMKIAQSDLGPAFAKVLGSPRGDIQLANRPILKLSVEAVTAHFKINPERKFIFGDQPCAVDLCLAPFLRRLPLVAYFRDFDLTNPTIMDYAARLEELPYFSDITFPIPVLKRFLVKSLPKMPPMSAGKLQHKAILYHYESCVTRARALAESSSPAVNEAADVLERMLKLVTLVQEHASFEEQIIYPEFESMSPDITQTSHDEHERETPILLAFGELVKKSKASVDVGELTGTDLATVMGSLANGLSEMHKEMQEHIAGEEKVLFPLMQQLGERQTDIFRKVYYHCSAIREMLLPFVLEPLNGPERMQYMHNIESTIRGVDAAEWVICQKIVKEALAPTEWDDLCFRLPGLAS